MIDVGPRREEHARRAARGGTAPLPLPPCRPVDRLQPRPIEVHADELRNRIERGADTVVAEVERVVDAAEGRHVDVQPLHRRVGRVVDRVRVAHARRRARRPFQRRGPAVDRELRFAVENDEHLLAVVVEMRADARLRLDHAAVEEPQVGVERIAAEDAEEVAAGPRARRARSRRRRDSATGRRGAIRCSSVGRDGFAG